MMFTKLNWKTFDLKEVDKDKLQDKDWIESMLVEANRGSIAEEDNKIVEAASRSKLRLAMKKQNFSLD